VRSAILFALISFVGMGYVSGFSADVDVPARYSDVVAGEKFYFELNIKFPENPGRQDLRLEYEVTDKEGNSIAQSKVLKAVETQASFIESITIPESAKNGLHIIKVTLSDYNNLRKEVSASFFIVTPKRVRLQIYFFILLGVMIVVGVLVIINIFVSRKRKR